MRGKFPKPSISTCVFLYTGHEASIPPTLIEARGEQLQEDITIPPEHDTPSPGSKVIEALEEEKTEGSSPHGETEDVQITDVIEHNGEPSMKELVEKQQRAVESEAKIKTEVEAAKIEEPKRDPLKIRLPRMKSVIVTPPTPAKQPSPE